MPLKRKLVYIALVSVSVLGVLCAHAYAQNAPEVSNVLAEQIEGTKKVRITYDVNDPDGDLMTVTVRVSDDGGATFRVPAFSFSGEGYGNNVASGTGKEIIWDAGADVPDRYGTEWKAEVIARDATVLDILPGDVPMEFVRIGPGTFTMGSPEDEVGRGDNEGPQHEVTISQEFYLGVYEITQAQWESVMGTRPWEWLTYVQEYPNNPAAISWDDVQAFIQKLNEAAGADVYRLPTEAEWEYSCRAGTTTPWSFGDEESQLGEYAWYRANTRDVGEHYAHAVGTKLPNPWGLYDIHGNVWESVQDRYGNYPDYSQTDPTGPETGSYRVGRGGSFADYARGGRSAARYGNSPDYRYSGFIGARLVRQGP